MSDLESLDNNEMLDSTPEQLPNATAILVLGIISIATCWLYGIFGIIFGIIAIVLHSKAKATYLSNKAKYEQSYKNAKAGFICGIIGLSLSVLFLIYVIVIFFILFNEVSVFNDLKYYKRY